MTDREREVLRSMARLPAIRDLIRRLDAELDLRGIQERRRLEAVVFLIQEIGRETT